MFCAGQAGSPVRKDRLSVLSRVHDPSRFLGACGPGHSLCTISAAMTLSQADDPHSSTRRFPTVPHSPWSDSQFDVGRNCWKVERADRVSFLVDGAAYFSAFREAAIRARHGILILGWDFDSRIRMLPDGRTHEFPDRLGEFLHHLLARRKQLHVYVLTWDFHMIYWREREWWLPSKLSEHRRLHFLRDGAHPVGASHHQKIVVIDDTVAFVGGMDFAACRWDTAGHEPGHPARRPSDGDPPCRPFHDVQMIVDGSAAAALGNWPAIDGGRHRAPRFHSLRRDRARPGRQEYGQI